MNRHKRKRAARNMTNADRNAGLRELTETANGAFSYSIIGPRDLLNIIGGAMRNDPHAMMVAKAINMWLSSAHDLGPGEAHQCLLCSREFIEEMPLAFAVVTPFARVCPRALVSGICSDCVVKTEDLYAAAMREWRNSIWPGLRPIDGGQA
jgi:hypothetical protein